MKFIVKNSLISMPEALMKTFTDSGLSIIQKLLSKKLNSPQTSSVGRLFDAVSSLLNICNTSNYEGQAAMLLEFAADKNETGEYLFSIQQKDILIIDWQPTIENILSDITNNVHFFNNFCKIS